MQLTKKIFATGLLLILICAGAHTTSAQRRANDKNANAKSSESSTSSTTTDADEEALNAELDSVRYLPAAERVEKLKAFIAAHPRSSLKKHAMELLVSAHAALGDELLKAGDEAGGIEQFHAAISESPADMSDELFTRVVSQIPFNLFVRGKRAASLEAARLVEAIVRINPKRLLALAGFYLNIEEVTEATRVAEFAVKLAPDMAAAHQALGTAYQISLRLDEAATEYARALELDPKSATARSSLANLRRANGKAEEALALYREQLAASPADKAARAGVVLSLFDLNRKDEAERELGAALADDPRNLLLLAGAAYWYAAHEEGARALDLAQRAVEVEPRYTWAHIALARALVAQKRPLDAERVLRYARQYGRFPTLDYELASALASAGLYDEAAAELARSFNVKNGQIETLLAGRSAARAASFIELLAPERRASLFQPVAADSERNARMLKGLLTFYALMSPAKEGDEVKERDALAAAQDFMADADEMNTYRQLYVADYLLQKRLALKTVLDLTDASTSGVETALDVPTATMAVMADAVREMRARAIEAGATPAIPPISRSTLSSVLRGRIEDTNGWALFNLDKTAEAVTHLRRAASVLPENTTWWRAAHWHLGAALEASGDQGGALAAYLKSYNPYSPDPVRRAIIEVLYRKVNGSLDGLDAKIGTAPVISSTNNGVSSTDNSNSATNNGAASPSQPIATTTAPAPSATTSDGKPAPPVEQPVPSTQLAPVTESKETRAPTTQSRETTTPGNEQSVPAPKNTEQSAPVMQGNEAASTQTANATEAQTANPPQDAKTTESILTSVPPPTDTLPSSIAAPTPQPEPTPTPATLAPADGNTRPAASAAVVSTLATPALDETRATPRELENEPGQLVRLPKEDRATIKLALTQLMRATTLWELDKTDEFYEQLNRISDNVRNALVLLPPGSLRDSMSTAWQAFTFAQTAGAVARNKADQNALSSDALRFFELADVPASERESRLVQLGETNLSAALQIAIRNRVIPAETNIPAALRRKS